MRNDELLELSVGWDVCGVSLETLVTRELIYLDSFIQSHMNCTKNVFLAWFQINVTNDNWNQGYIFRWPCVIQCFILEPLCFFRWNYDRHIDGKQKVKTTKFIGVFLTHKNLFLKVVSVPRNILSTGCLRYHNHVHGSIWNFRRDRCNKKNERYIFVEFENIYT